MNNYAILRVRKLKSLVQISATGRHNSRRGKVPNADPELTKLNQELVPPHPQGVATAFRESLPAKVRKNAVLAVEALFATSTPVSDVASWARSSLEWAKDRWGSANILSATLHLDEATPHLHCLVLPMKDGKLRGRDLVGNRSTLSEMQDSYHRAVSHFGLARGRVGSARRHIPAHTLRSANSAGEREKAEAVAEVQLLRAEIASLKMQATKIKEANAKASEARRESLRSGAGVFPQHIDQPKRPKAYPVPTVSEIMARGRGERGGI